jgi:UDPglucose--hexose-1-phosphate uridylyltransferase
VPELRFHPFLGEWVVTAENRQGRTFHPPAEHCPLCPTLPGGFQTEILVPAYDVAVFENRFPSLTLPPAEVEDLGTPLMPTAPAGGVCEVVCYSDRHDASLATVDVDKARLLVRVWMDRSADLGSRPGVAHVFVFENRGHQVGVTLSHPHGQVYGYPFVPSVTARVCTAESRHFEATGRTLCSDWLAEEIADGQRVVEHGPEWASVVPFCARYPYELWLAPKRHIGRLQDMDDGQAEGLAHAMVGAARRLDGLFGVSMPYLMCVHQTPVGGDPRASCVRVEFLPFLRTADRLKYRASSETGAGVFLCDVRPEEAAERLRSASVQL